jgi:hypothetical protein
VRPCPGSNQEYTWAEYPELHGLSMGDSPELPDSYPERLSAKAIRPASQVPGAGSWPGADGALCCPFPAATADAERPAGSAAGGALSCPSVCARRRGDGPITASAGPEAVRSAGYRYGNTAGNVQNPFLNHPTSQRHFPP